LAAQWHQSFVSVAVDQPVEQTAPTHLPSLEHQLELFDAGFIRARAQQRHTCIELAVRFEALRTARAKCVARRVAAGDAHARELHLPSTERSSALVALARSPRASIRLSGAALVGASDGCASPTGVV